MFLRRTKRPFLRELREAIWPSMGLCRTLQYYKHRLLRGRGSTNGIVNGLAIGVSVSFVPLLGTHLIEAFFLCWLCRASKLAAFVGTGVGNPLTFPLVFWLDYKFGSYLFGLMGYSDLAALPGELSWGYLFDHPFNLFAPLLLGGVLLSLVVWPLAYAILYYPVFSMRKAYSDYRHG